MKIYYYQQFVFLTIKFDTNSKTYEQILTKKKKNFLFNIKKFKIWQYINLKESLFFSFFYKSFLNILLGFCFREKNIVSKFSLIKIRLDYRKKSKKFFKKIKFFENLSNFASNIFLNDLIIFPIHKINFSNIYCGQLKGFSKKKNLDLKLKEWFIFINKKLFMFFKISFFFVDTKNFRIQKFIFLKLFSTTLEKNYFFFEIFSLTKGIIVLISPPRNYYSLKILCKYFILGFFKLAFFTEYSLNYEKKPNKQNSKNNITKFFFFLSKIFRFDLDLPFFFLKLFQENFKLLPSKTKIPLNILAKFNQNYAIFKKTKKKIFKRKKEEIHKITLYQNHFYFQNLLIFFKKFFINSAFILKKANDFFNEKIITIYITSCDKIFREENIDIWLNPFFVQIFESRSGLIEVIPNSISLHDLKFNLEKKEKKKGNSIYLSKSFKKICNNFIESLVGYSLLCFFLQIKDRHNGNILINPENRIIHIDFGFILGNFPGNMKFEADSFKFSRDFLKEMGGKKSEGHIYFKELFLRGFFSIRKNFGKILKIARKFLRNKSRKKYKILDFQKRLMIHKKDSLLIEDILEIIENSVENWKTIQYDQYQFHASGIQ
jgi:hypothetical protein